jgi:hypothetical protein
VTYVVANLDFMLAIHLLHGEAAVADQFAARFQNHGPETVAVLPIAT